jgi:hypothetical protein
MHRVESLREGFLIYEENFIIKKFLGSLSSENDINNLCAYDLYSPAHNVLDACISITRGSGRGLGLEFSSFLGPVKWHRAFIFAFIFSFCALLT